VHSDFLNGSLQDWDLPEPANTSFGDLEEPDYAKFENVSHVLYYLVCETATDSADSGSHSSSGQQSHVITATLGG
jgi:hypothetical protein